MIRYVMLGANDSAKTFHEPLLAQLGFAVNAT